ncbi:hypothetical protein [Pontibacter fetidus]|uniref:Uncharacterized protein n=1 Tax=Pontibacter fetidus TaxID=2700082 RepID=A0A6B2H204_9BACT|nr:hypothetical protein [Pontibacter fetidus]NDK54646.1 hypothetical protein [Pontibacter fetidus]
MTSVEFLEKIRQHFDTAIFQPRETEHELDVLILTAEQKLYNYYLWIESNWTTLNIGATLKSAPEKYFWYEACENNYENNLEWIMQLLKYSFRELDKLLNYETRIIQKKGMITTSFECQYLTDKWNRVSKNSIVHSNIALPKIHGRNKVYT